MNPKRFFPLLFVTGLFSSLTTHASSQTAPAALPPEVQAAVEAADTRKEAEIRIDAEDPLMGAWHLARMISGDHEMACSEQLRCVVAMVEAGRLEEAARLTRDIPDYQSALGSLRCAEALLEAGKTETALEQMSRVEKVLGTVKPWQQNVIRVRMAAVGAQAGWDDAKIEPWLKPLELSGDRFGARTLVLVRRMLKDRKYELPRLREHLKSSPTQKAPIPELVEAARLLLGLAPGADETDSLKDLISGFEELLGQSQAYAAAALLDLAAFWHARGDAERAKAALARAQPQIGFHLDIGGRLFHQMAGLWKLGGSVNDVRPFFEKLEPKARALAPMDRPAALCWLAACWRVLGHEERGDVLMAEAVKEAAANPNPRMRLKGGVEICMCHAHTGRPLPLSLAETLTLVLRGSAQAVTGTP